MHSVFDFFKKLDNRHKKLQVPITMSSGNGPIADRINRLKRKLLTDEENKKIDKRIIILPEVKKPPSSCSRVTQASGSVVNKPNSPKASRKKGRNGKMVSSSISDISKPSNWYIKPNNKVTNDNKLELLIARKDVESKSISTQNDINRKTKQNDNKVKNSLNPIKDEKVGNSKNIVAKRIAKIRQEISSEKKTTNKQNLPRVVSPKKNKFHNDKSDETTRRKIPFVNELKRNGYKIPKKCTKPPEICMPPSEDYLMDVDAPSPCDSGTEEKMDWEVNEIRKDLDDLIEKTKPKSLYNEKWEVFIETLILVIDTNIYISNLPLVERLCQIEIPGYGAPVIYVPRRVLVELDGLKENRKNLVKNSHVSQRAYTAIHFLNSKLSDDSRRVKGQTLGQYLVMNDLGIDDGDDKILLSCLQLKKNYSDKRIILLSNDTNLRCKAAVESFETYSANEFDVKLLNNGIANNSLEYQIDTVLRTIFCEIICHECKIKKKFYNVKAAVASFLDYWPTTFSSLSPVAAEESLKRLKIILDENSVDFIDVLNISKTFLNHFRIKAKPYYLQVEKALDQVNDMAERLKILKCEEKMKDNCRVLQAVFEQCFFILQDQLAKSFNHESFSITCQHISSVICDFTTSLNGILNVSTDYAIKLLANSIRICINGNNDTYVEIIKSATESEEGRTLLKSALNVFEEAFKKIPNTNVLT